MRWLTTLFAILILAPIATSTTLNVPGDYPTIQEAIRFATAGDSVLIAPGTYVGFHAEDGPDFITVVGSGAFTNNPTILLIAPPPYVSSCVWLENVVGWEVGNFAVQHLSTSYGSGVELWNADKCYVHHIDVMQVSCSASLGLLIQGSDYTLVERCLVRAGYYDVVGLWYSVPNLGLTLRNLTLSGDENGICNRISQPGLTVVNCLVYNNEDDGIEMHYWLPSISIRYNNSWGNNGANYYGFTPDTTNLSLNPLLLGGPGWQAYLLTEDSPCINAGDPTTPLDPDSTIADIGCFYFDSSGHPNLTLDLEPVNPPIIIPIEGGSFQYTGTVINDTTANAFFEAWAKLLLPNGYLMGPLFVKTNMFLAAGDTLVRQGQMYVSPQAMPGTYVYHGYVGDYPNAVWAADTFSFEKPLLDAAGASGEAYSTITDGDITQRVDLPIIETNLPTSIAMKNSPNPFNPSTAISYKLQASSHVSLRVYDTTGRLVGTLVDREMPAGAHTATFDGSQLASGIYLAVLEAGGQRVVDRLLLIK